MSGELCLSGGDGEAPQEGTVILLHGKAVRAWNNDLQGKTCRLGSCSVCPLLACLEVENQSIN